MRKIITVLISVLFFLNFGVVIADDFYEGEPSGIVFSTKSAGVSVKKLPVVEAVAAIAIETSSGRVLFEKNAYSKRPMASTTKIMTAIVAIENGNLQDVVTVSKRAAMIWGSEINLKAGEKFRLNELLYGLLLNSGNDAAIAIAEHVGGSVESFCEMMNDKAIKLGAHNTNFKSPHGLDMPDHYTTAYDLALITKYALTNRTFSSIVATKSASIPGKNLYNTNEMLGVYPGANGVKTGYTGQAGRCLVTSASKNGMKVISVVLNSPTRTKRAQSSKNILDYAFENYRMHVLLEAGQYDRLLQAKKGLKSDVLVGTEGEIVFPLREDELTGLKTSVNMPERLEAPVLLGSLIGNVNYELNGRIIASAEFRAKEEVLRKGFFDYLYDVASAWR